ncbi:hypothetical protein B0T24DRAFT_710100 [Lasiosphaeria ovina]|uniref:Uncharacterized protein n=1 Tax=Lasiosphaeria ovina TaxID=92902 RepID=A0AAE0K0U8_9PEZI|nr:hypothetical protein B0T24DRAFT_710100 [Lasiosphaeria ovina]
MSYEFVPTFLSNDASFCPCNISASDKSAMGDSDAWDLVGKRWETSDKYCESVMNLIMTFNGDARNGRGVTTIKGIGGFAGGVQGAWYPVDIAPRTDPSGHVLIPLQTAISTSVSSSTPVSRDVFGNPLLPETRLGKQQPTTPLISKGVSGNGPATAGADSDPIPGSGSTSTTAARLTHASDIANFVTPALVGTPGSSTPISTDRMTDTTTHISGEQLPPTLASSSMILPLPTGSISSTSTTSTGNTNVQSPDSSTAQSGPGPRPTPPPSTTASAHGPISTDAQAHYFNLRSEAGFLMVSLIPVLLATLLSIPIQILTSSISHMLPFRALSHSKGATAAQSLCVPRSGNVFTDPLTSARFLREFGDPLLLCSVLLSALSAVLVALSSETIRVAFMPFHCAGGGPGNVCPVGLRQSELPTRAVEGVLAAMAALVGVVAVLLARWRSGVAAEPWSVAALAALLPLRSELRALLLAVPGPGTVAGGGGLVGALEGRRFRLGWKVYAGADGRGTEVYGIDVVDDAEGRREDARPVPRLTVRDPPARKPVQEKQQRQQQNQKLTCGMFAGGETSELAWARVVFLVLITALLVLILYYENTQLDTAFEAFMDSQSFGVRILFTALGTVVGAFWGYYFSCASEYQVYQRMARTPQPARRSVLLAPPASVFAGLRQALFTTSDASAAHTALAALLAKFTPILFSAIPFRNTVTWRMHEACTWLAVAVLGYMLLVLSAQAAAPVVQRLGIDSWWQTRSMSRPGGGRYSSTPSQRMSVRPDSIAGCLYYVCDSAMLRDLEGLAMLGEKERARLVGDMGRVYVFGDMLGIDSRKRRVGIDYGLGEK